MKKHPLLALLFCIALILIGSVLAHTINTSGGKVDVQDLRFNAADGSVISALLYKPKTASADNPAPGILATHGYINSRETQSGFAIELSRRGFVVLAIDQTGHGYSDPPTFSHAFGALPGLEYLRSLDFVDTDRIGLEGHSMGGWASRAVTQLAPDSYNAIVLEGASTAPLGRLGDYTGSPTDPKNIAIVFSLYDEFSRTMWQGSLPQDLPDSPLLKKLFGVEERIEPGKIYGNVADGTGRILFQPATTHPGDHISPTAILHAVEWLELTLNNTSDISADDTVFLWKEIGTLIALVGIALAFFPLTIILAELPVFAPTLQPLPNGYGEAGISWWFTALLATAVPVATFFWLQNTGQSFITPNAFWPQQITNGIVFWALGNGLITAVLLTISYWFVTRRRANTADYFGFNQPLPQIGYSFLLAVFVVAVIYAMVKLIDGLFTLDFRFWVVALKPMSTYQFKIFLFYAPAFVLFFLTVSALLNGPLRQQRQGLDCRLRRALTSNALILSLGLLVLLIVQYAHLFSTGVLLIAQPLLTIVAIQFIPLLIFVACISTFCFRLTGRSYLGAFINGLFVSWYVIAGQATHFA